VSSSTLLRWPPLNMPYAFRPLLRSPLHLVCERGSLEILQMLFDGGADPNFCDGWENWLCIYSCLPNSIVQTLHFSFLTFLSATRILPYFWLHKRGSFSQWTL
jgi:hypothetical protein